MSQPGVAGVAGGAGATTLARALWLPDQGRYQGGAVAVLVCRDTVAALGGLHQAVTAAPGTPVVAVVPSAPQAMPRAARARVQMLQPHIAGMVELPWVSQWRELVDPWQQATGLIRHSVESLPKHLRRFARGVAELHRLLTQQGRAGEPSRPAVVPAQAPDPAPAWTHRLG